MEKNSHVTLCRKSWIFTLFMLVLGLFTIPFSFATLEDNLIHAWTFEQSSGNLEDQVGSLDLEVWKDNPTEQQSGINGYSVLFDGNDAYYQNGGSWSPSSDMTICAWYKFTTIDRLGSIVGYDRAGSNEGDWNYLSHTASSGKFQFWIQNLSHGVVYVYTDESPKNNEWEFNCVYWGGGKYGMWRNGTRQANEASYPAIPYDTYFTLGADRYPDYYVMSYIDEFYIWDRVLSDQEVTDLWNGGTGLFLSSITSNITNVMPTIDSPINITQNPVKNQDIHCSYTPRDNDTDPVNVSATWYVNGVLNSGYDYNKINPTLDIISTTGAGTGSFTGTTTKGYQYLCQLTITDGTDSNVYNSSATTVINSVPTIDSPINITQNPVKNQDIHCSYTPRDNDTDSVNVSVTWYVNGVLNSGYDYNKINPTLDIISTTGVGTGSFTGTTTKGYQYLCQLTITDGTDSNVYNSSATTVINSVPTLDNIAVWEDLPLFNPVIECSFVPHDNDSDSVNVSVTWYKNDTLVSDYDYVFVDDTLEVNSSTGSGTGSASDNVNGNEWNCQLTITDSIGSNSYNSTAHTVSGIPYINVNMELVNQTFASYDYLFESLEQNQSFYVMANYTHDDVSTEGAVCEYYVEGITGSNISLEYNTTTEYYDNLTQLHQLNFSGLVNVTIWCNSTEYNFSFNVNPYTPPVENASIILVNQSFQEYNLYQNMSENQQFYVFGNYTLDGNTSSDGSCKYFVDGITGNNVSLSYNVSTERYENRSYLHTVNITGYNAINVSLWCNESLYYHSLNVTPAILLLYNVTILYPKNNTVEDNDPLIFTVQTGFNFTGCELYSNYSGSFELIDDFYASPQIGQYALAHWQLNETSGTIAFDSSGNDHNCTLYNTEVGDWTAGKLNNSLSLDGVNEYGMCGADYANFDWDDPFSIEAWIKTTTVSDMVLTRGTSSKGWLYYIDSTGKMHFILAVDLNTNSITKKSAGAVNTGLWTHTVITYNGNGLASGVHFYINGLLQDGSVSMDTLSGSTLVTETLRLGRRADGLYFNGVLDEVAVYDVELTLPEIQYRYNNGTGRENTIKPQEYLMAYTNYSNLSHDIPPNTITDILYYVECNNLNTTYYNSSQMLIHYNNDYLPPVITFVSPNETDTIVNHEVYLNFTTDEIATCAVNDSNMTLDSTNGTTHSWVETVLSDGFYSFEINCSDSMNYSSAEIMNLTKDTTLPTITWFNPVFENTSYEIVNEAFYLNIMLNDTRDLFAYEVLVYDTGTDLKYNYTEIGFTGTGKHLVKSITPDIIGSWVIEVLVTDSHTKHEIPDYPFTKKETKIKFSFDKLVNKKTKEMKKQDVSINYVSNYTVKKIETKKLNDRYNFAYGIDLGKNKSNEKIEHKFKVECDNIHYVPNSDYIAHFVCYDAKKWVDFENPDITSWYTYPCHEQNQSLPEWSCYEIELYTTATETLEFSSIGDLNVVSNHVKFDVVETSPITGFSVYDFDLSSTTNVILIFVMVFLWISLLVLAFYFNNFGFASAAFFIGIVTGLLFAGLHIFLTLAFIMLNIGLFVTYAVKFR